MYYNYDINLLYDQMLNQSNKAHFDMSFISHWKNLIRIDQDGTKTNTLVDEIRSGIRKILNLDEHTSRILIFGRNQERPESLFEIMLSIKDISKSENEKENLIYQIWEKFSLFTTPEILSIVSIILYILSSTI